MNKIKLVNYIKRTYEHFGDQAFERAFEKGLFGSSYGCVSQLKKNAIILMAAGFKKDGFKMWKDYKHWSVFSQPNSNRKIRIVENTLVLTKPFNKGVNQGSAGDYLSIENGKLFREKQTSRRGTLTAVFSEYRKMKVGRPLKDGSFYYYC